MKIDWDAQSNAIYLYLTDDCPPGPYYQEDVHGDASLIVDVRRDDRLVGIEMLGPPLGASNTSLTPQHWVLAGRAWEVGQMCIETHSTSNGTEVRDWTGP